MSVFTFQGGWDYWVGQMAVIDLMVVDQSNLTNGFSCMRGGVGRGREAQGR